jgi:hypothetical protein
MHLVILFAVVSKLVFVSGDCNLGTAKLNSFNWDEVSTGTQKSWYLNRHTYMLLFIINNNFLTICFGSN